MIIQKIIDFLKHDLWQISLNELSRGKLFLVRLLRIVVLALRGFDEDRCALRASALTFYSLLSVVPTLALAFGIAQAFGLKNAIEDLIVKWLQGQEEVMTWIINFANKMLESTSGGIIAGIGVVTLLWFVIKLLSNIEKSFNDIWGVTKARQWSRKLTDYLAIIIICPILLITASSTTIFIKAQIMRMTEDIAPVSTLLPFSFKFLPYLFIWLLFTFIYIVVPNTKVRFTSAILGGIVAGTIFGIVQWAYITFQIGASKYGAIYGSFAALPLFLIWLQLSWLIVLFGSEICFAYQNVDRYAFENDAAMAKPRFKKLVALRISQLCVRNFCDGERPYNAAKISNILEIPIRFVNQILFELVQCRILSETNENDDGETGFQPARDVNILSVNYVVQALEELGSQDISLSESQEMNKISGCLAEFSAILNSSETNLLLKDI